MLAYNMVANFLRSARSRRRDSLDQDGKGTIDLRPRQKNRRARSPLVRLRSRLRRRQESLPVVAESSGHSKDRPQPNSCCPSPATSPPDNHLQNKIEVEWD